MTDTVLNDLLRLLHDEDLLRLRRRAEKRGMPHLAQTFTNEIAVRKEHERQEREERKKNKKE